MTRERTTTWDDPSISAGRVGRESGLALLQAMCAGEVPAPPILSTVGFELDVVEEGRVVFALEPGEHHYNPIGSVHGGVYATVLDSATGCAVHSLLPAGVGYTSLDLTVKFLRAMVVETGRVRCVGTVSHLGGRTALAEARLTDGRDRLLAAATSSILLIRPEGGAARV
jgi:uncharacterized protein (TIGR00369 family)